MIDRLGAIDLTPILVYRMASLVDSAVLALRPLPDEQRAIARAEVAAFVGLVQAGFKQPRKTLANSLADGLGVDRLAAADRPTPSPSASELASILRGCLKPA